MNDDAMGQNPFGGLPFFGDMMKALSGQGPLNWDMARQFALMGAGGTEAMTNVDPVARISIEQLVPIAKMHVLDVLGFSVTAQLDGATFDVVTSLQWCHHTLEAYKPLFDALASALAESPADSDADINADIDANDPMLAMMRNLTGAMAPAMLGMTVGSMIGQLATKAFGQYDLLVPREPANKVLVVAANIDDFASDWSLSEADMRMWVLVHELTCHAVLGVPHIREAVLQLVQNHVSAFRPDPSAAFERIGDLEGDATNPMTALQEAFSNPEVLLGAVISPAQQAMMPHIDTLVATLVGLIDWAVDTVTQRVLGGATSISEAIRRRRIETTTAGKFVEHLLGIHYTRGLVERGRSFVAGVLERTSADQLLIILQRKDALPTPAEIDAPGLWLARLGLD